MIATPATIITIEATSRAVLLPVFGSTVMPATVVAEPTVFWYIRFSPLINYSHTVVGERPMHNLYYTLVMKKSKAYFVISFYG